MDKIRDFFYNKNDIVVAILVLVIAGVLIYFRINAIMDYPSTVAAQHNRVTPAEPAEKEAPDDAEKEIKK